MWFFSKNSDDQTLIEGIRAGGTQRRLYENRLYDKYHYFIRDATFKHKITGDDAASVYGDAVFAVIENLLAGRFEGKSELKTYLYQIFSNKCVDLMRHNTTNKMSVHRTIELDNSALAFPDETQSVLQQLMRETDVELLRTRLNELGEKCREMLMAWGEGYSDKEIATMQQYNSDSVAKVSRLRCLEKLKEKYQRV